MEKFRRRKEYLKVSRTIRGLQRLPAGYGEKVVQQSIGCDGVVLTILFSF